MSNLLEFLFVFQLVPVGKAINENTETSKTFIDVLLSSNKNLVIGTKVTPLSINEK